MKISQRRKLALIIFLAANIVFASIIFLFDIKMTGGKFIFVLVSSWIVSDVVSAFIVPSRFVISFVLKELNGNMTKFDKIELIIFLIAILGITFMALFM